MNPRGSESAQKVLQHSGAPVPMTAPTSLSELVTCFECLGARDDGLRAQIARMLGREWIPKQSERSEQARKPEGAPSDTQEATPPSTPPKPEEKGEAQSNGPASPLLQQTAQRTGELHPRGPATPLKPELQALPWPDRDKTAPELLPLLRVAEQRSILATALEMPLSSQEPDVKRIIRALATGQALRALPMHPVLSLGRGAQVMRDLSPPLWGFFEDQSQVLLALQAVVGPMLACLNFFGDPFMAGPGSSHSWKPYQSPSPGVPVLVLSELGQVEGGPAAEEAAARWLEFGTRLGGQGSPCIVLTPLRPVDFPASLRRAFILVQWDRSTRLSSVRQARRDGGSDVSR